MNSAGHDVPTPQLSPSQARHVAVEVTAIPSSELLRGQPYVPIDHGGVVYWLRATRAGKLILTK